MKSKLYKTHRKPSYYRLRRLGYFSLSLMVATILVVVPLTLAQATTSSSPGSSAVFTSESNSSSESQVVTSESSDSQIEPIIPRISSDGDDKVRTFMVLEN